MIRALAMAAAMLLALIGCGGKPAPSEAPPSPSECFVFDYAEDYQEGMAAVLIDDRWGFVDNAGVIRIEPRFAAVEDFVEGMARVAHAPSGIPTGDYSPFNPAGPLKWGYVDRTGRVIVEPRFERASDFYKGVAIVSESGGEETFFSDSTGADGPAYYAIDRTGRRLHEGTFDYINEVRGDFLLVERDERYGFVRRDGGLIIPPQYDDAWPFDNGLAAVKLKDKWGFIDATGKVVVPFTFDDIRMPMTIDFCSAEERRCFPAGQCFHEGRAAVRVQDRWGTIDRSGRFIVEPRYEACGFYNQGLAPVWVNKKWGFIDRDGRMAIEPQFDDLVAAYGHPREEGFEVYFREGLAGASVDGKYGFIDKTGRFVIAPQWFGVEAFDNGIAQIFMGATFSSDPWPPRKVRMGLVDRTGRVLVEPRFNVVEWFSDDRAFVLVDETWNEEGNRNGGKWGVIDFNGRFVVSPKYDAVGDTTPSRAWVCTGTYDNEAVLKNKHWQQIDRNGTVLQTRSPDLPDPCDDVGENPAPEHDKDYRYGYVDATGAYVIPPQFENARDFRESLAAVSVWTTRGEDNVTVYGFIDRKGRPLRITRP